MRCQAPLQRAIGLLLFLAAASSILQACDSTTFVKVDEAPIQTARTSYDLRPSGSGLAATIDYVFTNRTAGAVYLPNCLGGFAIELQRWDGGEWNRAWSPTLLMCLSPPIVIEPESTLSDTLRVWGALPGTSGGPQFDRADPSGLYRIVWLEVLSSYDQNQYPFGATVPEEYRVSNSFHLVLSGGS